MKSKVTWLYLLTGIPIAIMIFMAGVLVGILQTGKIEYLSHNLDLSDLISAVIMIMLLFALRISLTLQLPSNNTHTGPERIIQGRPYR